jgi:hypothetical protein
MPPTAAEAKKQALPNAEKKGTKKDGKAEEQPQEMVLYILLCFVDLFYMLLSFGLTRRRSFLPVRGGSRIA